MNYPLINDSFKPSLCVMIPLFKRNYFSYSFPSLSKQTYSPKFYVIIQNDNRIHLNLTSFKMSIKEHIYHI